MWHTKIFRATGTPAAENVVRRARLRCMTAASGVLLATGCSTIVPLSPRVLPPAASEPRGQVAVAPTAEGVPATIGHGTISLFAIPVESIQLDGSTAPGQIMDGLRDALRSAGYSPVAPAAGRPIVSCRMQDAHFKNYTWFMPVIKT